MTEMARLHAFWLALLLPIQINCSHSEFNLDGKQAERPFFSFLQRQRQGG